MRAARQLRLITLLDLPVHWLAFGFERMIELGLFENLLQDLAQGIFAGAGATYLFTRSVACCGPCPARSYRPFCTPARRVFGTEIDSSWLCLDNRERSHGQPDKTRQRGFAERAQISSD
jgi:hypothetical protein